MYQMTAHLLATDKEFKFSDVRVYLHIASNVDCDCKFSTPQSRIARKIGLSRQQVNTSIKKLREKDLISEVVDEDGVRTYYINPYWVTRGRYKDKLIKAYEDISPKDNRELEYRQQITELALTF